MCGIAGISGDPDPSKLSRASALLAHRGPDDSGQFIDLAAGIGLAHRRLSIIDVSEAGKQPMFSRADRGCALVFNGEIYNFRELRTGLEADGYRFLGHSDTEVLL